MAVVALLGAVALGVFASRRGGLSPDPSAPIPERDAAELAPPEQARAVEGPAERVFVPSDPAPARGPSAVQMRLVDAATGEPVPYYEVRPAPAPWTRGIPPDASSALVTDAEGLLMLPEATQAPGEKIVLTLLDAPSMPKLEPGSTSVRSVPLPELPSDRTAEVAIEIGPTYPLEVNVEGDVSLDEVYASLVPIQMRAMHKGRAYDLFEAPLRHEGGEPWVRFAPLHLGTIHAGRLESSAGPPWTLHFLERGRGYVGTARVERIVGVCPPVRVTLAPIATVRGTVRHADGSPVASAGVRLDSADGSPPWTWWQPGVEADPAVMLSGEDGHFVFFGIRAGAYELVAQKVGFATVRLPLAVQREDFELAIELVEALPTHTGYVAGTVHSRSGRYHGELSIVLSGPSGRTGVAVEWSAQEGGTWTGAFRLEDLVPGSYVVEPGMLPLGVLVEPQEQEVLVPAYGVRFEVIDDLPRSDVTFHAFDATSGEALASCMATIARADGLHNFGASGSDPVVADLLEEGFAWLVSAQGYVPAYGVPEDLARADDGTRSVEVPLEPGWGALLQVFDDEGPVEGATVRVDGELAGTTDADGLLLVGAPSKASSLTVERAGRTLCPESVESVARALRSDRPGWVGLVLCD